MNKKDILESLSNFINQRPGLSFADYGDVSLFRQDYREHCEKPLRDFRGLLSAVRWRDTLDADALSQAIRETNRVDLLDDGSIDYTPGQMGATEYRHAACNVLSRALRNHWREDTPEGMKPREHITRTARREFGRGIVARYFD